jgi:hypothetical protein
MIGAGAHASKTMTWTDLLFYPLERRVFFFLQNVTTSWRHIPDQDDIFQCSEQRNRNNTCKI